MDNRRAVQHTRVQRNAKIIVPRRSPVIHCTVQNIPSAGACLKFENTYGIPQTFDLTFEHGRTPALLPRGLANERQAWRRVQRRATGR